MAPRIRSPLPALIALLALTGSLALVASATGWLNRPAWAWPLFVAMGVFVVVADLTMVSAGSKLNVSGSFYALVVAAAVLGAGPAAVLGIGSTLAIIRRYRWRLHFQVSNLAIYASFPMAAGIFIHEVTRATHSSPDHAGYYLLIFGAFLVALALNYLLSAGYVSWLDGSSLAHTARESMIPLLSAELFSALLTVAATYLTQRLGVTGFTLFGLVLVIFQYLIGELLTSKRRSDKLQRIATTDELTGLGNREQFHAMIAQRIAAAPESDVRFAVLLMDLDRFKEINDTLGHHYGDLLLRELGPRLTSAIGEGGFVARLGGDEFGILLAEDADDPAVLDVIIARLFKSVSQPFMIDELSLEVGASVGVARFPKDGEDSHGLLRCADIAMYAAKEAQTDYKIYTEEQDEHSKQRLGVLSGIRHALLQDEIVVHYQPIIDLDDLRVRGAEGLVRWQHPEHGLIPPGAFVQTVEQTGLIGPLTRHVLERSIAECAAWRTDGRRMTVAVNLSVRNLLDRDLPKEIERLLNTYGLPPEALQLEITESMIMSDPERALATVSRLSDLGVRLSVDDFGTGYSSLANLRKMPIDELKIDRSFVSPMLRNESDLIIVRSTINLGHDLGLNVIAEGVEDSSTLERLATLGCDLAQGYHVSKPMPADVFNDWLVHTVPYAPHPMRTDVQTPTRRVPASVTRGGIDLGGLTFAAPEQ
jgi:diguanylate cyclase (GGDEF)-like protein